MKQKFNSMRFFWWLRKLLFIWVRSRHLPDQLDSHLDLDPNQPVCYILGKKAYSDLLVLDQSCIKNQLPRPHSTLTSTFDYNLASFICLKKIGLVLARKKKEIPSDLLQLLSLAETTGKDVQIVPVSVYWGRHPGSHEKSWFKLLFADNENTGILQRFFTILAHGRGVICNFGKPISVRQLLAEGLGLDQSSKKLRRVLKVHYRGQRTKILGPEIYVRNQVIASIVKSKAVTSIIEDEHRKTSKNKGKIIEKAQKYADEIAADITTTALRFFDILLSWLWKKVYKGIEATHFERLRALGDNCELVYVPCHRSHIDYLLISYLVYHHGMTAPHTAAGVNLKFWPVGGLLRRGGAFFIRRSFRGNRLYTSIFKEYVNYLLTRGHPIQFFPEGGRSRTGKLMPPKTGMLSMVIESYLRDDNKPILFVPVYVAYDRVMEGVSYVKELGGKKKNAESMGQLLKAASILVSNFGKAYVGFGKPIPLEEFFGDEFREIKASFHREGWSKKFTPPINRLAHEMMTRVNNTALINGTALVSLALLSNPRGAIAEDDLIGMIDKMIALHHVKPYDDDVVLIESNPKAVVNQVEKALGLKRLRNPSGDIIHVDEYQSVLLTYYRNNILHLYGLPSLIAACFQHRDDISESEIVTMCQQFYPFLREDLFLKWDEASIAMVTGEYISAMKQLGLLRLDPLTNHLCRPDVDSGEFTYLNLFARMISGFIERIAIASVLLDLTGRSGGVDKKNFEKKWGDMAHRLALLNGGESLSGNNSAQIHSFLDILQKRAFLFTDDIGNLQISQSMEDLIESANAVLSPDIRQSLARFVGIRN